MCLVKNKVIFSENKKQKRLIDKFQEHKNNSRRRFVRLRKSCTHYMTDEAHFFYVQRERDLFYPAGTKCSIAERRTTELLLHSSNVSTLLWLLDKNKNTSYHYIVKTTNVYCGAPQRCGRQELSSPHNKYSILYTILTDLHEVVFVLPHVSKVECIGSSRTWCRGRLVLTSVGFMSEGS